MVNDPMKMSERKFTRALGKPGMAAQLRETVSQVVRESTVQNKPRLVEPINFEEFVLKNRTLLQNDPHRELLLHPSDDVSQVVQPRTCRTVQPTAQSILHSIDGSVNRLTTECLKSYAANWNMVHYKYAPYSGTYLELPRLSESVELTKEVYEIDTETDQIDEDMLNHDGITKEGFLMKGPEIGISDRMFANIGSKSFKRRFCNLRQEVDGTYTLQLFKDEKKTEAKLTIVMDFCTEIVRCSKRGRYCFELKMNGTDKSYIFAADSENEMQDWLLKLNGVLYHYKQQEDKRASSLERTEHNNTPPPNFSSSQAFPNYGTLKGLDQSMNPQLIKYSRETDSSILLARRENRKKLFSLYYDSSNITGESRCFPTIFQEICNNENVNPYEDQFGQRIFIKCQELKFRLQAPIDNNEGLCQVEPYKTSLSLFDVRQGRKLSENFYFDINHDIVRDMLGTQDEKGSSDLLNNLDKPLQCVSDRSWFKYVNQAIFSVSDPHPDIFLVVRIEKILQGNISQISEPYIKAARDPRTGLRVHKNVRACCQRLGNYRMPFGWSARPLFRLYSSELDTTSDFPAIYRQETNRMRDDDILKLLSEYRRPEKLSKLTIIPGWLKLHIEPINQLPNNTLTTSLEPLTPFPLPPIEPVTLEIFEFESTSQKAIYPYINYMNHLYVYPQSLNFDTQKFFNRARNLACTVELRDDDSEEAKPLECIYSNTGSINLLRKSTCPVSHHNAIPSWYEEIKIKLPTKLHNKHHLLFSFYHISCDMNKKKDNGIENCVGYAWLNLITKGKLFINMEEANVQMLPVAAQLPSGYLSIQPLGLGQGYSGPDITWIDSQKSIFTVSFKLASTVLCKDHHLHNLFEHTEKILANNKVSTLLPTTDATETCKILKAAHAMQLATTITFFPTILNELFLLLTFHPAEQVSLQLIRLLIHIINQLHESGKRGIVESYVKFIFVPPELPDVSMMKTVHEQLAQYLPSLLQPSNTDFLIVNKFMQHSHVFFEIMVKSMAQHMLTTGRIKMHRNERFSKLYHESITNLLRITMPYLMNKYKELPAETNQLNKSLALFFKKCLTFMDRGFIFNLINEYMEHFAPGNCKTLQDFKFCFLQIICSHEHYVSLNLPMVQTRITSKDSLMEYCLSQHFCKHHFLTGLLLQEVKSSLNEVMQIRKVAMATLRDLMAKHELDDRYQGTGHMSRIAIIYIPWLGVVLENLHRLDATVNDDADDDDNNKTMNLALHKQNIEEDKGKQISNRLTMYMEGQLATPKRGSINLRDSTYFAAIAGQGLSNGFSCTSIDSNASTLSSNISQINASQDGVVNSFDTKVNMNTANENNQANNDPKGHIRSLSVTQTTLLPRCDKLQSSEIRDILICFLFVIKYIGDDQMVAWWQQCSEHEIINFFKTIEISLYHFKYIGKRQIQIISNTNVNANVNSNRNGNVKLAGTTKAMTLPARIVPPDFSSDSNSSATGTLQPHNISSRENLLDERNEASHKIIVDGNISTEVGLIALDCLGLFGIHFKGLLIMNNGDNLIMERIFNIYICFLEIGQSENLFRHLFASLRAFLNNYPMALFEGSAILCGRLCYQLLNCCNSKLSLVRQESCALLYLLMRSNFEYCNRKGLTRVHLQVIISVSQMLGNIVALNNSRFQESLSLINSYATSDKAMKGTGFSIEVKDLIRRIRTVLMATVQMREHSDDPEMLFDLQHSLANSYASTPELRHTWLDTMARNHLRDGNYSEAACCQLHIAALIAEYLQLNGVQDWGAEAFDNISMNISKDERSLKLDAGGQDAHYNINVLLEQLEKCAQIFDKAERYELLGPVYRLIIPIVESKCDYNTLANYYSHLSRACSRIVEVKRTGKRLLGRFYRVAFFGCANFDDCSEEEDAKEYIYKEPKVTSLAEISERLNKLYSEKFGSENVKMIMDSAPIDHSQLDSKIAYIQVTHVTPYFEKEELESSRITEFQQNHDVFSFMFETPFTHGGKPHGNPEDQWKRRTILYTDYAFPYIKKRISVNKKKIVELTPIEVALDEMRQRVQELQDVSLNVPTDIKKLQLRLQGSVCVTVNAGPLAYASAFLDPALSPQYPDDKVEQLKDLFKHFIKACYTALQINSKLITDDQQEYQQLLRENYHKLCQNLSYLLGETICLDNSNDCHYFKKDELTLFNAISGANSTLCNNVKSKNPQLPL